MWGGKHQSTRCGHLVQAEPEISLKTKFPFNISHGNESSSYHINNTKNWRMASGPAKNKTLEHKRFVHTRMTFTHLLMVTDRALKLDYTSVDFKSMNPKLILLPHLLPIIRKVSGSSYLNKTMAEHKQNASLQRSYFTR